MAYYNRTGKGKRACNILTRDAVGTRNGWSKQENSPLISDSVHPYNVLFVMQANQEGNFQIHLHVPPEERRSSLAQGWMYMPARHTCGGKGTWRLLLWLCESCTKCQECSSLFARASQVPTQVWQLGLFGENGVG